MDSAVCAAIAKENGYELCALTVDYGQKNRGEMKAAAEIAAALGARHLVISSDLAAIGGSALTDSGIEVPHEAAKDVPVTYVPARNLVLLSLAAAWAEVLGAQSIYIGANIRDYSGYPDCRRDFLRGFERTMNLGIKCRAKISVNAPLIMMKKSKIVEEARRLNVDLSLTTSCYDPAGDGAAECGCCASCLLRNKGILEADSRGRGRREASNE